MGSLVASATGMLHRLAENSDSVLVALSGGKDSLVVLDLCMRPGLFKRVEAFYLYLVKGLEFFEKPVRVAAARHKVTVHMVPHPQLAYELRVGECRVHLTRKVPNLSQVEIEHALRVRTGIGWIAAGHRMTDSLHRRGMLHVCSGYDEPGRRVYPIWDWAPKDVHSYLRARGIPIPVSLIPGARSQGFDLRPKMLTALRKRSPGDYAKVLAIFPFAGAQLFNADKAAEAAGSEETHANAEVRDLAGAAGRRSRGSVQPADDRPPREEEA
jgi:phosphoadenosine phosphosulfate reductase